MLPPMPSTTISILYRNQPGTRFDFDYYLRVHMPRSIALLGTHAGYLGVTVEKGSFAPGDAAPAFVAACHYRFESAAAFMEAFAPHAAELQADIARYTDAEAVIQFNEVLLADEAARPAAPARSPGAASQDGPTAIVAADAPARPKSTGYPPPFATRVAGRTKRALGDVFGLRNFGVNLTRLAPGAMSSVRHAHTRQDEFVYVLSGAPTLRTGRGAASLAPGMCAGFRAGSGNAHHLVNESSQDVVFLEIGDRTPGDGATYPDEDLEVKQVNGQWKYFHKDGTPY
jgi:uncharacterized protein (TIGR02118 family)